MFIYISGGVRCLMMMLGWRLFSIYLEEAPFQEWCLSYNRDFLYIMYVMSVYISAVVVAFYNTIFV